MNQLAPYDWQAVKEEVRSLKERIAELEAALKPVAKLIKKIHPHDRDDWEYLASRLLVRDIRRAAALMEGKAMWRR